MRLCLGCATDKGNFRSKNQDRVMCRRMAAGDGTMAVACVCDGVGSFAESEIASEMMVKGISDWFDGIAEYYPAVIGKEGLLEDLEVTIRELNDLVCEYRGKNRADIGCTMSLLLMLDLEYFIFHVGDSRICRVGETLFQMTQDEVVLKRIDGREKKLLANYIGKDAQLSIQRQTGRAAGEDVYLLGTDGLFQRLAGEDVRGLFQLAEGDAQMEQVCRSLVELVLERGERDNVSCAALRVAEDAPGKRAT